MTQRQPRYSMEEHARRGTDVYERLVRPRVEVGNHGKFIAVDIETGEYELGEDSISAMNRLLASIPDAQIWLVRIGHRATVRMPGLRMRRPA